VLRAGRSGNRIPVGARFSTPVQTGPGAHPASCAMGTGSFPGVKSGRGVTLTPHPLLVPWSRKSRAIALLPLWAVRPVQSLSACTRVHFFTKWNALVNAVMDLRVPLSAGNFWTAEKLLASQESLYSMEECNETKFGKWLWFFSKFTISLRSGRCAYPSRSPKTGHGPHSSKIFVLLYVLFVLCRSVCVCVCVYCTAATGWLPNCS